MASNGRATMARPFVLDCSMKSALEIQRAYHAELRQHRDPARRAGWRSHADQRLRHAACLAELSIGDLESVLDVGCGLGGLVGALRQTGSQARYLGVDLLPEMVADARERWPGEDFQVHDLEMAPLGEAFDLTVVCGTISLEQPRHSSRVAGLLRAAWSQTSKAMVLVVPHARATQAQPGGYDAGFHFYTPAELRKYLTGLSRWVTIREDLGPTDLIGWCFKSGAPIHRWSEQTGLLSGVELARCYLDRELGNEALRALDGTEGLEDQNGADYWLLKARALKQLHRNEEASLALQHAEEAGADGLAVELERADLE